MNVMNGIFQKTRHNDFNHALKVLSEKNKQIARNIANADTPFYKAKKLEFGEAMQAYYEGNTSADLRTTNAEHLRTNSPQMSTTSPKHMQIAIEDTDIKRFVRHQNNPSLRTDGNDVNLDYEMSEQASASILYTMFTEIAGGKFASMKEIIRTR